MLLFELHVLKRGPGCCCQIFTKRGSVFNANVQFVDLYFFIVSISIYSFSLNSALYSVNHLVTKLNATKITPCFMNVFEQSESGRVCFLNT